MKHRTLLASLLAALALACTSARQGPPEVALSDLAAEASRSSSPELVARWLLAELVTPGGDAERARRARARLDEVEGAHYLAHFARGLDDSWHGRLSSAPEHFLAAVLGAREAARAGDDDDNDRLRRLVAWLSASRALALRAHAPSLFDENKSAIDALIAEPSDIGWRAHSEVLRWSLLEARRERERPAEHEVAALGCLPALRLAGPFGGAAPVYLTESFAAEAPGPWPARFADDEHPHGPARVLQTESHGCEVEAAEAAPRGVYYAEGHFELAKPATLIVVAQGALGVWVDDRRVLERDSRQWGIWPKFGTQLTLGPGRHRLVARLSEPRTLVRLLEPDGTPLAFTPSPDPRAPYALTAPTLEPDPNELMRFIGDGDVVDPGDDVLRFLGAELLRLEGQQDVAAVLLEPLVEKPERASGPSLLTAATLVSRDPLFAESESRDLERELHRQALEKDAQLWQSELALAVAEGSAGGIAEVVAPLSKLTQKFPDVPAVWGTLANVYGRLGWQPEYRALARQMAERFPAELSALSSAIEVHEGLGQPERADTLLERLMTLDPDNEARLDRAVRQQDYAEAERELERLLGRYDTPPERLLARRRALELGKGNADAELEALGAALEDDPTDTRARLALADARYARGDDRALHDAVTEATKALADTGALERAIDVVEATTDFAPYRIDAREVIARYERAGLHLPGTAARVLDYAAVWVHHDGSSRMLEHEIIRVQSDEAIKDFAEHERLAGLVLNMRVIKQDGRTFEPELVAGKPTVTLPHLEIGDYIETEHVVSLRADPSGRTYASPRWFFREENVAYAHSEFVIVSPVSRELTIEVSGSVPEPQVTRDGAFVTRRWKVEHSPAAPVEPLSVPATDFLPSVRAGWGHSVEQRMRVLAEQVADTAPMDPRIRRIAARIVDPLPPSLPLERAQRLYRWVQDNVEDGPETDGRQVIVGRRGNRWRALRTLLGALDIPIGYAVAKNRLAAPPIGPMSEAESFMVPLLRVGEGEQAVWLTVQQKHAPFGYVPVEARGMPAYELALEGSRPITVPDRGEQDRVEYTVDVRLARDGSAELSLEQVFHGKYAIGLRSGLERVPPEQLRDVIEGRLLGSALPGATLDDYEILERDEFDRPLRVRMQAQLPSFAEARPGELVFEPPLMPRVARLATLATRQTPLLIRDSTRQHVKLTIQLAPGTQVTGATRAEMREDLLQVTVNDRVEGNTLIIEREVYVPAGRVDLEAYPRFFELTRAAHSLLTRPIGITGVGE